MKDWQQKCKRKMHTRFAKKNIKKRKKKENKEKKENKIKKQCGAGVEGGFKGRRDNRTTMAACWLLHRHSAPHADVHDQLRAQRR